MSNHFPPTFETHPYNGSAEERQFLMPTKKRVPAPDEETFGRRLARLRKAAGYSQRALATEIGISQRMVAYYEGRATRPPAQLLPKLADSLGLSVDQLLGHRPITARRPPANERLLRQLRKVEKLPPHARRSVLEHIDGLAAKYGTD